MLLCLVAAILSCCVNKLLIVCFFQASEATMETHTLARYISESTLQDYQFVGEKPSLVAAASMYLALRMKSLGGWVRKIVIEPIVCEAYT